MKTAVILLAALFVWIALAAAAMLPGSISTAFIPVTDAALISKLPRHISIIDKRGPLLVVYSENPEYVAQLYKAGAGLVLPARKKTCLNLQSG